MDNVIEVFMFTVFIVVGVFILGIAYGNHQYTPSSTFKAVCRVQGGEPYKHVTAKDGAVSVCLKGSTTIPVTTK